MAESDCEMMEPIGGYFSLELPLREEYHRDAIRLNSGRNCLEYILRSRKYRLVYIPYYTCEVVLEPFEKIGIDYVFYHVDHNLEILNEIVLQSDEALLYINYFGLKQSYVLTLAKKYGQQLIVDNTQAFYATPIPSVDTFYTCRKFFGVPDGAYLYTDNMLKTAFDQEVSWGHMSFLTKRVDLGAEAGYADFLEMEEKLYGQPIKLMSKLTKRIMQSIDYVAISQQRRKNYLLLHEALGDFNLLKLRLEEDAVPMVYPFMVVNSGLREYLIQNKIFVARYWPNVFSWSPDNSLERHLTEMITPLPIDQRYCEEEMKIIIQLIKKRV